MNRDLNVVPADFSRLEHGTTGAIARWARTGRSVPSVVVAALDAARDAVDAAATPAGARGTRRVAA